MTKAYDDIIHLPHHVSTTHPPMATIDRAAQFSPFAALTAHDAAVKETARLTDKRILLSEDMKDALGDRLRIISNRLYEHPEVAITYFQPDTKKKGGAYITTVGTPNKIDEFERVVIMTDGATIPIDEIFRIEGKIFEVICYE